jgi:hypothetical protein
MAISTNNGTGDGGIPFAKFLKPGDTLIGSFGGSVRRQQRKFRTQDLATKPDGSPKLEEILHLVAMPGTTAVTGDLEKEQLDPIKPGDTVRYSVSGFHWKQLIDARRQLPAYANVKAGSEASGDVVTITMTGWSVATENAQVAVNAGFKVVDGRIFFPTFEEKKRWSDPREARGLPTIVAKEYTIEVRRPRPDEATWEAQGDALFTAKPWIVKEPTAVGASDYEPF